MSGKAHLLVLLLTLALIARVVAQESVSDYFGFHVELVRANASTPLCSNVTPLPHESFNQTVEELFGPNNEIGLKAGSMEENEPDIIWVRNGDMWVQIYYDGWWRGVGFGDEDMFSYRIPNSNFSIEARKDTDWYIVFSGYVSRKAMVHQAHTGYNILNRGYPIPIRLDQSGIATSSGFGWGDEKTGDMVYIFSNGAYEGYYFSGKIWKKMGVAKGDFGDVYLSSSLAIDTRGKGGKIVIRPPAMLQRSKTNPKLYPVVKPPPKPYIYTTVQISGGRPVFFSSLVCPQPQGSLHH